MKILLLLCIGCLGGPVFAQKANPVINRYYWFTGKIDKYPVTCHLYRVNNEFTGHYYYNSTEKAIRLHGKLDNKDFLKLAHLDDGSKTSETFEGTFKDSLFSGTWSSNGKMLAFRITKQPHSNGLILDYVVSEGSKKIQTHLNHRDKLWFDAAAVWPAPQSIHAATAFLKQVIREEMGEKKSSEDISQIMLRQKNEVLNAKASEGMYELYSLSNKLQVLYRNPRLLGLELQTYTDQGGAHGLYAVSYTNIDLEQQRRLDIIDVMDTAAAGHALNRLLQNEFRRAYHLKKEEKITDYLFNDTIPISNNFLVTGKGITFSYLPYEIGPYVMGNIALFIAYKDIDVYLKPAFKKLVGR
jgi:Protein of unknown function (DUF3298).